MHDQSFRHIPAATLDEYLDGLLQEEMAALRWSQVDMEMSCESPLPGLIKEIVISAVMKVRHVEASSIFGDSL